jgi:CO/xanthine dehydrogenase Mo-binding subunit
MPGVVDYIDFKDVHSLGGINEVGAFTGDMPLFAGPSTVSDADLCEKIPVLYCGQMIGIIVADSARQARAAVSK